MSEELVTRITTILNVQGYEYSQDRIQKFLETQDKIQETAHIRQAAQMASLPSYIEPYGTPTFAGFPQLPNIDENEVAMSKFFGTYVQGIEDMKAANAGLTWEGLENGVRSAELVAGAVSNLVHIYYWMESTQERLENAQLRLLNTQDAYNQAVSRYGVNSQQAVTAHRNMEIAANSLERAHAREILNIGLLSIQVVGFGAKIVDLIPKIMGQAAAEDILTGAYLRQAVAFAAAHPWMTAAVIGAGIAVAGAVALNAQNINAYSESEQRKVMGIPQPFVGAQHGFEGMVSSPTLFLAGESGAEHVSITPRSGGVSFGDTVIQVNSLAGFDDAYERNRLRVKGELRRFLR